MKRRHLLEDCSSQPVDEVNSTGEGIRQVFSWDRGLGKKCKAEFYNMFVFSLNNAVLFRGVGTRNYVYDAILVKKGGE